MPRWPTQSDDRHTLAYHERRNTDQKPSTDVRRHCLRSAVSPKPSNSLTTFGKKSSVCLSVCLSISVTSNGSIYCVHNYTFLYTATFFVISRHKPPPQDDTDFNRYFTSCFIL